MPSLSVIRAAVAELPQGPPVVAAFAGGTTGIGSYVAKALATTYAHEGSKLRVYIIGRNIARAESVMAEGRELSPGSEWRFVPATDLALLSDVDAACAEIIRQETEAPFHGDFIRLDYLCMSHSYPILKAPTTTKEGLDSFMSTVYYSRIRFIQQLMPLLTASPWPGRVVSVYAGSFEDGTKPGDNPIGLPPPAAYSFSSVRKHTCYMKTFVFEEFAERHAGHLSLSHIFPGLVDGPGFLSPEMLLWWRIAWRIIKPLAYLAMTSPDDCGHVMLYPLTASFPAKGGPVPASVSAATSSDGAVGGGCYTLGARADSKAGRISYEKMRKEGTSRQCWEHTMRTFAEAEKQGKATTTTTTTPM